MHSQFKLLQFYSGWSHLLWNILLPVDLASHQQRSLSHTRRWTVWFLVLLWSQSPGRDGQMLNLMFTLSLNHVLPIWQPKHPTISAFVRASTLSLGSIAFGSLIVALLELLRLVLNAVQQSAAEDGHRMHVSLTNFFVHLPLREF